MMTVVSTKTPLGSAERVRFVPQALQEIRINPFQFHNRLT